MASSARDTLLFPFVLSAVVALVLLYVAACKLFVAYYRDDDCPPSMGDAKEDDAHEATPIYALTGVCVVHPNGKVVFGGEEEEEERERDGGGRAMDDEATTTTTTSSLFVDAAVYADEDIPTKRASSSSSSIGEGDGDGARVEEKSEEDAG